MTYLIGAGIGFAFFIVGEFAYFYGKRKGLKEANGKLLELLQSAVEYGKRKGLKEANGKLLELLQSAVEVINTTLAEAPLELSEESFNCGDEAHVHTDAELDEFLATHKCEDHDPIKEASNRKRVAEALKAHMRNRKTDGTFAKGSKPKKK